MSPADTNPWTEADLEELAAYVEDRLDASGRARVEARVARDDAYAELLADAVMAWDDEEDEEVISSEVDSTVTDIAGRSPSDRSRAGDMSRARRRWHSGRQVLALAASLVLVPTLMWFVRPTVGPDTEWSDGLVSTAVLADERWSTNGLPRDRGFATLADAFALGVLWEDVTVASRVADTSAKADDVAVAVAACGDWATVAEAIDMGRPAEHLKSHCADDPLAAVTATRVMVLDALTIRQSFGEDLETAFTVGRWAESARLWALAGDLDAVRRVWRRQPALDDVGVGGSDDASSTLQTIDSLLAAGADATAVELELRRWIAEQTGGFVP
ncbi:MAG: hypothetical protein AAGE94_01745 [Acidobacteriota bacterium]